VLTFLADVSSFCQRVGSRSTLALATLPSVVVAALIRLLAFQSVHLDDVTHQHRCQTNSDGNDGHSEGQLGHGNTNSCRMPTRVVVRRKDYEDADSDGDSDGDGGGKKAGQIVAAHTPWDKDDGEGHEIRLVDVACGADFTLCVAEEGTVYSWGCNEFGCLGRCVIFPKPPPSNNGRPPNHLHQPHPPATPLFAASMTSRRVLYACFNPNHAFCHLTMHSITHPGPRQIKTCALRQLQSLGHCLVEKASCSWPVVRATWLH
jgi:hypothetical protein